MSKVLGVAFEGVTGTSRAEALASLMNAAIEITAAYASREQKDGLSSKAIPDVLEATFNKLHEIAKANRADQR